MRNITYRFIIVERIAQCLKQLGCKWQEQNRIQVDTGAVSFAVENDSDCIFQYVEAEGRRYEKQQLVGPVLCGGEGNQYQMKIGQWSIMESGAVCTIVKADKIIQDL